MVKKKVRKSTVAKAEPKKVLNNENKEVFAFIATFFSIVGFLIAVIARRKNDYVIFYAKQSLVIFIISVLISLVKVGMHILPFGLLINAALNILIFVAWVTSWIFALSGEKTDVPIIGELAKKIKL